ncbi:MAG TPA: protein kinase [Myxococcota bacterium]|jgi:CheY-like chemotaxis protein|nr:protein kinase [Myxococcota bacterium]
MSQAGLPARIGQYDVVRRLAYGGMAEVLLGRLCGADGFRKDVVIKRVLPHLASNAEFITMFRDEARITARLHHGNIVQVLEFAEADGPYYLALEYVHGTTLGNILHALWRNGAKLGVPEVAHVGIEVARALDYAHRKLGDDGSLLEIVHRDVSPSNVLVSVEGEVKLADFGIARARQRLSPTQAGHVKGKFAYMAPEALTQGKVDARSDLFALGAVLFEALTNTPAFRAENEAQTIHHVLTYEVPPPSTLNPEVPPRLDEIVLSLMQRDPARRPARGLEVVEALGPLCLRSVPPAADVLAATVARLQAVDAARPPREPVTGNLIPASVRRRVLVVDESRTLRALVKATLGARYVVIEAATVEEASALMRSAPPGVVLCQRVLSGASGLDLCRAIRADAALGDVRFILLTGDETPEVQAEAAAAGADAVLPKRLEPARLDETIDRLLRPPV